jgi:2'-5' RNA ligase
MTYKNFFNTNYQSKASLNSPPHITLHMPFKLREDREYILKEKIDEIATHNDLFSLGLNGFGQFQKRVIYVHVETNDDLTNLFLEIRKVMKINFNIYNADYKNRGFNPHITLAFRDLKKEAFKEVWPDFENVEYKKTIDVNNLCLLKHNGQYWDILECFSLGSKQEGQ